MHLPLYISQHLSPFNCCKQSIHPQKQLNFYQSQLIEPVQLSQKDKTDQIQKMLHLNQFYKNPQQQNFKVVLKSNFDKQQEKCHQRHQMFVDSQFRPDSTDIMGRTIVWRRLSEVYSGKDFKIVDLQVQAQAQFTTTNTDYGLALRMLKDNPKILRQIFRTSQQISNLGIYKLILNDRCYPRQIVIDDYIPMYLNSSQHVFIKPGNNHLWPLLIQKALAKITGSYSRLQQAKLLQIMRILIMAPTVQYQISNFPSLSNSREHQQILKDAFSNKFIMWCTQANAISSNSQSHCIIDKVQCSQQVILTVKSQWNDFRQQAASDRSDIKISESQKSFPHKKKNKTKYSDFIKEFSSFSVCYFKQNYNMDFYGMDLPNCKPIYFILNIKESCDVILSFSRLKKKLTQFSLLHLSQVERTIRQFMGIKGGWLRILIAKKTIVKDQVQHSFFTSTIQTDDSTLTLPLKNIQPGIYTLYLEGYSQEDETQSYALSAYGSCSFLLQKNTQSRAQTQYFLEQVMLNHCLNFDKALIKSHKNQFIEGDSQSWYVSKLLYREGGFGYVVIYLSQNSNNHVKLSISIDDLKDQGYRLQCKTTHKYYNRLIKPGQAQVIVLSLSYLSKKYVKNIQFPPKCLSIQIMQNNSR